ncbi:GIY-YIG nuclease family protein [Prochlorococcus marinus]|uniref:GIY-YIG nuclease family protein n=1 Tax=Prochlorococcus marinus TaxID=1219 RepID=UPI0022B2ED65|nr:GIY-YIG nuclease family protein [Prochlorococcus marinus]
MSGWLYLIRNRDLYKIGITKNFKNRMRQLKPHSVVAKFYTADYVLLERELHNRYKKFRIPQTEYFRLEKSHIKEIKQRIFILNYPLSLTFGICIKSILLLLFLFFLTLVVISLYINDFNMAISKSLFFIERISFGLAFISLFVYSGKYLSFCNELKYRSTRLIIFILFSFLFRLAAFFFY